MKGVLATDFLILDRQTVYGPIEFMRVPSAQPLAVSLAGQTYRE